MKQTIFEIRQQAEELIKEAIAIWKQSNQNDMLEDIESDPVFSLMLTALAYQLNDIDSDIERFKQDVLDEYSKLLVPYDMGRAIPATAVISTNLQPGISALAMTDKNTFILQGSDYQFIPLLETKVLGAEIASIVRLDARRWRMTLDFKTPVTDISGFAFAINNPNFKDLDITIGDKKVPLTKPWDYAGLPLNKSFALDTILYEQMPSFNAPNIWLDMFARQNSRLFCVKKHKPNDFFVYDTESLDFTLEFKGINRDFVFDKDSISLNTILLVNAIPHTADLSAINPIARVAGYNEGTETDSEQFMHLVRPSDDQLYNEASVDVRTVAADRFNRAGLLKLLNSLTNKFDSDYYAFQQLREQYKDSVIRQVREGLQKLQKACAEDTSSNIAGTYIMLRSNEIANNQDLSVGVNYLTTNGAFVNSFLNEDSTFALPTGLDAAETRQIMPPIEGSNEVVDKGQQHSMARYYFVTNDRVVTPADMKMFCYYELMTRYSISADMIEALNIHPQLQEDRTHCGYEIQIEILVTGTPFIKRHFTEKIPQAELFIQKMIEVRSTSIYPIQVNIQIVEPEQTTNDTTTHQKS